MNDKTIYRIKTCNDEIVNSLVFDDEYCNELDNRILKMNKDKDYMIFINESIEITNIIRDLQNIFEDVLTSRLEIKKLNKFKRYIPLTIEVILEFLKDKDLNIETWNQNYDKIDEFSDLGNRELEIRNSNSGCIPKI